MTPDTIFYVILQLNCLFSPDHNSQTAYYFTHKWESVY